MTDLSKENMQDKVAVAFRLVGGDERFRQKAEQEHVVLSFQVKNPSWAGTITIKEGRIAWGSGTPDAQDITMIWRDWQAVEAWVRGRLPLWWHRVLRQVKISGSGWNPAFLECIYLFRHYLQMVLDKK